MKSNTYTNNPVDDIRDRIQLRFGKQILISASELQAKSVNMTPVIAFQFDATSKKRNTL